MRTLDEYVADAEGRQRFGAGLIAALAAIGLVLACVGVYGVVSYEAGQRTKELGVRVALGASAGQVFRSVLGSGLQPVVGGVVLGLIAAAVAVQPLAQLLYGVQPRDPLTFALAPLFLMLIALLACCVPARRAMRADPIEALRSE